MRLISRHGQVENRFHSFGEDEIAFEMFQDCQPVLDSNKDARNNFSSAAEKRANDWNFRRLASIPHTLYHEWLKEGMPPYDKRERMKFIKRKLRDPNYQYLLTDPRGV